MLIQLIVSIPPTSSSPTERVLVFVSYVSLLDESAQLPPVPPRRSRDDTHTSSESSEPYSRSMFQFHFNP